MTVEVQYYCPNCDNKFVVYHRNELRNTHCCYCKTEVTQTGRISKLEGEEIVVYQDGVEIERLPKRG